MDDKNIQTPTQVPPTQLKDWRTRHIDLATRQKALKIIIEAMKRRNPKPEFVPEIESIAKRLEEKVFAAAVTRLGYLERISRLLKEVDKIPSGAANSSIPAQANEGPSNRENHGVVEPSNRENHGVVEPWRENTYKRLMAMRSKYTLVLESLRNKLTVTVEKLNLQRDNSNQPQIESLKEHYKRVWTILSMLNLSKDKLLPKHEVRLDDWENKVVSYLRQFVNPKYASTFLEKDTQETISGAPSLPTYNDQEMEPSFPPLVIPPGISPSSLIEEYNDLEVIPPGISPSPLLEEYNNLENSLTPQSPFQRLINAVSSSSQHAFKSSVDDMQSVMRLVDRLEGSGPTPGSRSSLGQDLTGLGTSSGIGETRRYISSVSTEMWSGLENPRIEAYSYSDQSLRKEVEEVNQRLIDTRVNICERKAKDMNLATSGIVIECVFIGVSVTAGLKSLILGSKNSSTILVEPLLFLVPTDYPKSSPIVLGEFIGDDISSQVRSKLATSLGGCTDPITVSEIARKWDVCAREVITEFAEKYGGGTFSSRYGKWENF